MHIYNPSSWYNNHFYVWGPQSITITYRIPSNINVIGWSPSNTTWSPVPWSRICGERILHSGRIRSCLFKYLPVLSLNKSELVEVTFQFFLSIAEAWTSDQIDKKNECLSRHGLFFTQFFTTQLNHHLEPAQYIVDFSFSPGKFKVLYNFD